MRLDRLITLGVVQPIGRAFGRFPAFNAATSPGKRTLPVLMYHSISDDPEPAFSPYYKVCTSPQRFAEHMQWLAEAGWRGVTLSDGLAWLEGNGGSREQGAVNSKQSRQPGSKTQDPKSKTPPSHFGLKPVAITFDDGFRDFQTAAFPALEHHGFSATMYLPTAFIGENRQIFKSRECLSWPEVRELAAAGVEFGSHTVNHPKLTELTWPAIERELRDSRVTIEQQLARSAPSFAYPYAFPRKAGKFALRFRDVLIRTGYESCATTTIGRARASSDRLQIPRLPVNSDDDRALLNAKLIGAYDWLATPQQALKNLKRARSGTGSAQQTANPGR